jgi:hypothetical protein
LRPARTLARLGRICPGFAKKPKEADMSLPKSQVTVLLSCLWFAAVLTAQTDATSSTSDSNSKVRIVRLSEVKGDVLLDRSVGRGMGSAIANLPIVEQNRLETGQGVAEVEFEDNSSLRVGLNSLVEFPKLERTPTGATVSSIRLVQGTAYVSLLKSKSNNQFTVLFGDQTLSLNLGTHIRLELTPKNAELAVLDGTVTIQGQDGPIEVSKKRSVTFDVSGGEPAVAKSVDPGPLDAWDKQAVGYHDRLSMMSGVNNSPYSYGVSDLNYYGSFMDAGGCGTMWRPYFASAGWDPFANGSWSWYGSGYSWVSPYPWGWMPYHYGSWSMCPGVGWGWQPGGQWNGLNNMAMLPMRRPAGGSFGPPMPRHPPRPNDPTLVPVNLRPLVRSQAASGESFEFRKDSAGLGVPRETLGKLGRLSAQTVAHGTASTEIYVTAPTARPGTNGRGMATATPDMMTIHRGSAPGTQRGSSVGSFPAAGGGGRGPAPASPMPSSSSHPASAGGRPR